MERYFIYKVTFDTSINELQKEALNELNKHLPNDIIVNTSTPVSKSFADGKNIGIHLEIESEAPFTSVQLSAAVIFTNEAMNSDVISSIEGIGENIIDTEQPIITDLVSLSE